MYRVLGGQSVGSVGGRPASGPALFMRSPVRDRYRVAIGPSFFLTSPSAGRTCERVRFFARAAALALASGTRTAPPRLLQKKIRRRHQNPAAPCGWLPSFVSMPVSFSFSFLKNFFDLCGFHLVPPLRKLFFFPPGCLLSSRVHAYIVARQSFLFFSCVHLR
ncbi:hypothetical protein TW95_gp1566 [Pandoravirus inopinatum]|uniref:Uncharacterized protein n=1 Tax=Pandoravirus inopinatum TaxID=1605721 RepID=A0A0B5J8N9_9VIRU|nr:hypothetical protein TW95_gp1566 [Pandoravirus inopinatum]AJF98300.1 hypothetical protein [Pandoravirus inopinatum]